MRLAFLTILICIASVTSAQAQTKITKDGANAYYQNCLSQPSQGITDKSKEYLCACTAAKMMERMDVEDVKAMALQNEEGRKALNYMLVKVYAPCMNYPAKDHYYNNCMTNPQTKTLSKNPHGLCKCMSDEVAQYLGNEGPQIFEGILKRDPNITDPMIALTNDKQFQSFAQSKLLGCVGM